MANQKKQPDTPLPEKKSAQGEGDPEGRTKDLFKESQEERLKGLMQNLPDALITTDLLGNITYVNNRVLKVIGYEYDELIGSNFSKFVTPEYLELIAKRLAERQAVEKELPCVEIEIVAKKGNRIPFELSTSLVTEDGIPNAIQIIARDISERKLLERRLLHSQKMEAIGRLAGGVAHDMNNVLGAIMAVASAAESDLEPNDPHREDFDDILKACGRGRDLTRSLLDFASKGRYVREEFFLNEMVAGCEALLKSTISKKMRIQTLLEKKLFKIEGDRNQIGQVLMNVCINAADAMQGQGMLSITTKNILLDRQSVAEEINLEPGEYVELKVLDTGVGMNAKTLEHAFEPFFTTKPHGEGTGLGLSMVYGTIRNHSGTVKVESELGVGTSVTILLPAVKTDVRAGIRGRKEEPLVKPNNGNILLVDDEELIRKSSLT